jgi:hypothetical protein
MIFRKRKQAPSDERDKQKNDELEEAEARANTLVDRAVQLQTLVMRRDQENHWQQAVNKLFSGGKA